MSREKSTVEQIRERFDNDVERFSSLETGQQAAMDSLLGMQLVTEAASASTPGARHVLDVGCGAGNYTLKLLQRLPGLDVTLIDLSRPMLERAVERIEAAGAGRVQTLQGDIREIELPAGEFDVILAASVLHHLRSDDQWQAVFRKFYESLRPGGSVWIFDLVEGATPELGHIMQQRYADYLTELGGEAYRDRVFAYIEEEDTPRPLMFQVDLLRQVGFSTVEVLHRNACFAVFGAIKEK